MPNYKTTTEHRLRMRTAGRLRRIGMKLVTRNGGYAILCYNDVVNGWVEADGMSPIPYSLDLEDAIKLTHEYLAEAEINELRAA